MSFSKINKLRHEGKLKQAYELANQEYQNNKNDIWAKRALAWVYYDLLKNAVNRNLPEKIIEILVLIKKINLQSDEQTFFESLSWQLGKYLFHTKNLNAGFLQNLFDVLRDLPLSKPSESYSFLIKAFSKHASDWDGFYEFFEWWGMENFRETDYKKTDLENGKKVISLVEQIYIAVSKILLREQTDTNKTERFIPLLEKLTAEHPEMQYPHYYLARLLLATGNKERFFKAFIPFAGKKKRDFWVWDLLGEAFEKNDSRRFACLCRSLGCGAPVKFSLNVKEKFASLLIEKKMFAEAKHEINEIVECRKREGWKLTPQLENWLENKTLQNVSPVSSNKKLYEQYAPLAEKLLYYDIKPDIIVVNRVNYAKKIIYFTASGPKNGSFLYGDFNINPRAGDFFEVRFGQKNSDKSPNFYRAFTVEPVENIPETGFCKTVSGKINIGKGNSFGFVNDVFVPPEIVSAEDLKNGQTVTVFAVQSFNKKKKQWGWLAVKVIK